MKKATTRPVEDPTPADPYSHNPAPQPSAKPSWAQQTARHPPSAAPHPAANPRQPSPLANGHRLRQANPPPIQAAELHFPMDMDQNGAGFEEVPEEFLDEEKLSLQQHGGEENPFMEESD